MADETFDMPLDKMELMQSKVLLPAYRSMLYASVNTRCERSVPFDSTLATCGPHSRAD